VVPSHLLDRELVRMVEASTGADPWIDAEGEEEGDCGEPGADGSGGVVSLGGRGGA
jgi:hypothetical protein